MFELLIGGGWLYYASFGIACSLFLMTMLFMAGVLGRPTVWHGLAFGFTAAILTVAISNLTNLISWITVGLTMSSWAGVLLVAGIVTMVAGMMASYVKAGSLVS